MDKGATHLKTAKNIIWESLEEKKKKGRIMEVYNNLKNKMNNF